MKSVKAMASVLLILGLPTMGFLTFFVAVSFLFSVSSVFGSPPLWQQIAGYISLAGPIPLLAGAMLLFFSRTRVLGAKLVLAGSFILSVYIVVCYTRLGISAVRLLERVLWFGIVPLAVLVVDYTSYRAYLAVKQADHAESQRNRSEMGQSGGRELEN